MPPSSSDPGPRLIVAAGAREAERVLLECLEEALPRGSIPAAPVRVVVPSNHLRQHLIARLAGCREAWLGVEIATLRATARAVLERCGERFASGAPILKLLVERAGAREPALARVLGGLNDAFSGATAAVRDLLDAGFREEHLEALLERVGQERDSVGASAVARAAALLRVAADARAQLAELGLAPDGDLFARAAERVASDPERALPASALFVHGFADATGVATDLLQALVRRAGAIVVLVRPTGLDGDSAGDWRFGRRLAERLSGVASVSGPDAASSSTSVLRSFEAFDPSREASAAVTLAFDAVARSEGRFEAVSIIARDFAPYRSSLAREIARQGLPASGSAASPAPVARRARTLVELLERRDETPIGTLLALGGERLARSSGLRPWELRLAWASRGATRLETVCELRFDAGEQIRLPCRDTLRRSSETSLPRASRRTLSGSAVAAACAEVAEWRARLRRLAGPARLADAIAAVRELVAHLALDEEEGSALDRPLAALAEPPLGTLRVDSGELSALLREAWSELGARHLGGAGSGVALLTVTEARAMVFDHVVLLGLARDRFPRRVRSEPFLPDAVRVRLRDLLPDLPVKAEGHDEERFLFAQLLGAASSLDLLHSTTEGDGRKLTPSVFLDELARCGRIDGAEAAPPTEYPSAVDLARDAALAHGRKGLSAHLEAAIEDARHLLSEPGAPPQSAAEIAAHRVALLGELGSDPSGIGRDHLGPFFGFVGDRRDGDPRAPNPPVTTLEALARCGWRAFLEKVLRLQPLPADGEEIPELPRRLAGSALHRVLERFAPAERRRLGRSVEELAEETPSPVAWPEEARLKALGREAVHHVLIEEGFDPELFAAPLENVLAELLGIVHDLDWRSGSRELLGIEADGEGVLAYRGRERPLPFRADRVELEGETLLLTDYKVGRAVSDAARAETRSRHLWREIARGERLQLVAYARATSPRPTCGRLLFVAPGLPDNAREVRLGSDELDAATLDQVFETLYDGWDRGSYLPRLLGDDRRSVWSGCDWCAVRVACLQGDSGERGRLARWLEAHAARRGSDAAADAAFRLWNLGHAHGSERGSAGEGPE